MTLSPRDVMEASGLSDGEFVAVEHPHLSLWLQAQAGHIRLSIGYTDRLPMRLETCRGYEVIHDHLQERLMNYVVIQETDLKLRDAFALMTATAINWSAEAGTGAESLAQLLKSIVDLKTLFSRTPRAFTEDELRGHVAELLAIHELLQRGAPTAPVVEGWKAPTGSVSDFVFAADHVLEVKSARPDGGTITISSVAQLDPESGSCQLMVWPLDSRHLAPTADNDSGRFTVPELIDDIRALCSSSEAALAIFNAAVESLHLTSGSPELAETSFSAGEPLVYDVSESFPAVRARNVPTQVRELTYTLRCSDLREYSSKLRIPAASAD